MKRVQITKRLNSTELGKGNTNDTYILVDQSLDVSDIFINPNEQVVFTNWKSKKQYNIRLEKVSNNEWRIPGLGQFVRDNHMEPGDFIVLEKNDSDRLENYRIGCIHNNDYLALNYKRDCGFEILVKERIERFNDCGIAFIDGNRSKIKIVHNVAKRKRSDSPTLTDYFSIIINNEKQLETIVDTRKVDGLEIHSDCIYLVNNSPWGRYEIEMEDNHE